MGDAAFEALWKNVLDHWEEDRAHGAFLEHCRLSYQLPEAAARYRGMKGDRDRYAIAEKRLTGVAVVALAALESTRSTTTQRPHRVRNLILAASFGFAAFALFGYLLVTR